MLGLNHIPNLQGEFPKSDQKHKHQYMRQRDNWCINDSYICYGRTFFHDLAQLGLEKYYFNHEHLQVKVIRSLVLNQRSHTTSVNYKQNSNYYIIIMIIYVNFFLSLFYKKKKKLITVQSSLASKKRHDSPPSPPPIILFQNWTCTNTIMIWNWLKYLRSLWRVIRGFDGHI